MTNQIFSKIHYSKYALIVSIIITLLTLITTIHFSIESNTAIDSSNYSDCKMSDFLNLPATGPRFRYCQTGLNTNVNETIKDIQYQLNTNIISKNGNISLNHIICILMVKKDPALK
jgi:hypothetical protein